MKPIFVVDGKHLEVYDVYFNSGELTSVTVYEDGLFNTYYDDNSCSIKSENFKSANLKECLHWITEEVVAIEKIRNRIEAYEERMIELSFDYIKDSNPFAQNTSARNTFLALEEKINGLQEAIDLIIGDFDE